MSGGMYLFPPLGSVCSSRGPESRGVPIVDDGAVLTFPVDGLVVIASVWALKVTDISEFRIKVYLILLLVVLQSFGVLSLLPEKVSGLSHVVLVLCFG